MKVVALVLVLASVATPVALASAQPAASNASSPLIVVPSNSSSDDNARRVSICKMPNNAFGKWWYNTRSDGPHYCYGPDGASWGMLSAYRSGGTMGVHWKYTDDENDPECMSNWDYYAADGKTLIQSIYGITTWMGDTKPWCGLPVYRTGGIEGKQWGYCACWYEV